MPVVINEFEAVVDDAEPSKGGKGGKAASSPVTSQARLVRTLARVAARQNRLKAH